MHRRWRKLGPRLRGRLRISAEGILSGGRRLRRFLARRRRKLLAASLVACSLAGLLLVLRAWSPGRRANLLGGRAAILLQSGQVEEAADVLAEAQRLAPDAPRHAIARADALVQLRRLEEAEGCLRGALERVPGDLGVQAALGGVLLTRGRTGEAVTLLAPLLPRFESHQDASFACQALTTAGQALAARGELGLAEAALRKASAARSPIGSAAPPALRERALVALCGVLQVQRRTSEVEAALRDGLRASPDSAALGLALARLLERAGRVEEAVHLLEPIVTREGPYRFEAAGALSDLLIRVGRLERAEAIRRQLPEGQQAPLSAAAEGRVALLRGDLEAARQAYARLADLVTGQARPLLLEAGAAAAAGQLDRARAAASRALEREPGNQEAERTLLELEERAGDLQAVRARAERLLEEPVLRGLAIRTLFALHARDDDAQGGLARLESLRARYPADLSVRAYLAIFRVLAGQVQEGVRELSDLAGQEGLPAAFALVASAREGTSDALEAIELLAALAEREESFAPARLVLAQIYARLGRLDLAAREVDATIQLGAAPPEARLLRARLALQGDDLPRALAELEAIKAAGAPPREVVPLLDTLADRLLDPRRDPREDDVLLAARLLEQAVALEPARGQAHARLGRAQALQGLVEQAELSYARALELSPELPAAHGAASLAFLRGDAALAAARLRTARAATGDPRFGAALAAACALTGEAAAAREALRSWVAQTGDCAEGRVAAVLLQAEDVARTGVPEEVLESARGAAAERVEGGPGARTREALELFGLWGLGSFPEARLRSARIARDHPGDPLLLWWAQRPLLSGGDPRLRVQVAELLAGAAPSSLAAGLELAGALRVSGDQEGEGRALEALRGRFASDRELALRLGMYHARAGHREAAIAEYRRAIVGDEPPLAALNNLACLLVEDAAQREEGLELAWQAWRRGAGLGETWDTLGWALLLSGQVEEAERRLSWAATLRPAQPSVRYHLARALAEGGKRARALNHLRIARLMARPFPEQETARALELELELQLEQGAGD